MTRQAANGGREGRGAEDRRSLRLDDQLCFALYAALGAMKSRYRPLLDEIGLTYPQFLVMLVLWERGSSTVKEITAALGLDYGTLSPLLKRLEALGLVRRERRSDDERSVNIVLTDAGIALQEPAAHAREAVACLTDLPPADFAELRAKLTELTASLAAET